jgi:Zn-dependent protease with chaperone function
VSAAGCLGAFGLTVALLAPGWLTRVAGSGSAPRLGVAAWFVVLAAIVASWSAATLALARSVHLWLALIGSCALVATAVRVGWVGVATFREMRARGAAHARMVAILGHRDTRLDVLMLDAAEPLIYCLRGPVPMVVVTTGARQLLNERQLSAALAHERAHLAGRHHLLLALARAAGRVVPWLPVFAQAEPAVSRLLEMRADDVAAARYGRRRVAAAIAAMSARPAPTGVLGAAGPSALARGIRLCTRQPVWRVRLAQLCLALTVLVLAAAPYLSTVLPFCADYWW